MIPLDHPSVIREVQKKQRLMKQSRRSVSSSSSSSLPPGQNAVKSWIVLDLGLRPPPSHTTSPEDWSVKLVGPTGSSVVLRQADLPECQPYPKQSWHCVTGWSASDLNFEGVSLDAILKSEKVRAVCGDREWKWLFQESADGYTVPVAREDAHSAFLAVRYDGKPIPMEHGGPRLCFPELYGWKSAKWAVEWRLQVEYEAGLWEKFGCHSRGRVAREERFREGWIAWVGGVILSLPGLYRIAFGQNVWVWVMQMGGAALGKIVQFLPWLHSSGPARVVGPNENGARKLD